MSDTPDTSYLGVTLNGRYVVERELGRGGIGVVYLARDKQLLSKAVVIKVLLEQALQSEWTKRKFFQELEALARIDHPGIVGALDAGETPDGKPYIVMQFIEGVTLRSVMTHNGMELQRVVYLIRQIGQALSAAHDKQIYHRDLKPENIMLQSIGGSEQQVKIIDFGVARVEESQIGEDTMAPLVVGTFAYMAPEQLSASAPPSAASDVFSLGVMTYEMLVGKRPFEAKSVVHLYELQRAGVKVMPCSIRSDIPEAAQGVILKALSFDPKYRYSSARDFGEDLARSVMTSSFFIRDLLKGISDAEMQQLLSAPEIVDIETAETPVTPSTPIASPNNSSSPQSAVKLRMEAIGGAVPLQSKFYVVRNSDAEFQSAIARRDSIILVKGVRQMGKTSLLARGLQQARDSGAKVILTDFQTLNENNFKTSDVLFRTLGESIAEQLDLNVWPDEVWDPRRGPNVNFRRYMQHEVLEKVQTHVVWGLDEVDRLFSYPFHSEVFGLFRSWHNARALDPEAPWHKLSLVIAYATEVHLFIRDLNQSPFNVGTRLVVDDFTSDNVSDLNNRYGEPLKGNEEIGSFMRLVGGHPYLVRRGLHEIALRGMSIDEFNQQACNDEGPLGDHLRHLLTMISRDVSLRECVKGLLTDQPCSSIENFYKLRSIGIVTGDSLKSAKLRCKVYADYFKIHLT